jgi:hypothetical protein
MEFINNPFDMVIQAVKELYPDTKAYIQFNPYMKYHKFLCFHIGECGCTTFNSGSIPVIDISTHIPFEAMIEILAHELSHVVAGEKHGHDETWNKIFDNIHKRYTEIATQHH